MQTFKRILAMPYGTSSQQALADSWYIRFIRFFEHHEYLVTDAVWSYIHNSDVGYQARRRYTAESWYSPDSNVPDSDASWVKVDREQSIEREKGLCH